MDNNEMSFESIFNMGVGIKPVAKVNTTSVERFDGDLNIIESEFQNSVEELDYINSFNNVSNYNTKAKLQMINRINKEYGHCNRGIENYCRIQSLEADAAEADAPTVAEDKKPAEQPKEMAEKKEKWYQKVWNTIKKIALAIWHAIVKVFKVILKIITFGHYGKNKKEEVNKIKEEKKELDESIKLLEYNPQKSLPDNSQKSLPDNTSKQLTSIEKPKKICLDLLKRIEHVTGVDNKPLTKDQYAKKQQELKKAFSSPTVENNKEITKVKEIVQNAKSIVEIKQASQEIDKIIENVSKITTSKNPDIEKIEKAIKDSEPKIRKMDQQIETVKNTSIHYYEGKSNDDISSDLNNVVKKQIVSNNSANEIILSLNTGYFRILNAINNIFGKALIILKKILTSYLENTKSLVQKSMISSISFRDDYYNSFIQITSKLIEANKVAKRGGNLESITAIAKNYMTIMNDKYINSITEQRFKGGFTTDMNLDDVNNDENKERVKLAFKIKKQFAKMVSVINELNDKDDYSKLTYSYNINASTDFKNYVINQFNSNTTEKH